MHWFQGQRPRPQITGEATGTIVLSGIPAG